MSCNNHLELLTTENSVKWKTVLDEIGTYMCYHLPEFHRLCEIKGEGTAVMPVFREDGVVIAFPMMIRDIKLPGSVAGEPFKDATSVGGFVGPIASSRAISETTRQHFLGALHDFFQQNRVITAYHRLNPILKQEWILEGHGELNEVGVTLSLDLTIPEDEQLSRYRKHLRKEIGRLKRKGLTCEVVGREYIDDFIRIYYSTMDRVEADSAYYFDRAFFDYLMSEMADVMRIFICKQGDEVISASICAYSNGIIENYLGGTDPEYFHMSPSKLVHDFIREWGNQVGATTIHLGGGVGAQKDSLYWAKLGFGPIEQTYNTWRYVVNQTACDELYESMCNYSGFTPETPYFPSYRHPKLQERQVQ